MTDDRNKQTRDDVATLVRLAGSRPPVPKERFDRAKAAAHAAWQAQHRRRSRRYTAFAVATAAVVVLAAALLLIPDGATPVSVARETSRVEAVEGEVWARGSAGTESPRQLQVGDTIEWPADLSTSQVGQVAIRLASGHSVRLDRGTRILLEKDGLIALDRGAVYVDSGPAADDELGLIVRTRFGDVEEIGTQFEVRLAEENLRVRLREGVVLLTDGNRVHRVEKGTEITVKDDGSTTVREFSVAGPEWDWVARIAPMFDLEGRTAREFLDWVARERGWTLAFADPDVARAAEETLLAGASPDLDPEAALETVLPTCRMAHQITEGVLLIDFD